MTALQQQSNIKLFPMRTYIPLK